jgi:HD-GYP domain-containing protein (c-di-GMP phosphodiesterase class II)
VAFELDEQRLDVAALKVGMFVSRLDRPWQGTPFPLQGLALEHEDDLDALRRLCQYVYVDRRRQVAHVPPPALARTALSDVRFRSRVRYDNQVPLHTEAPRAHAAFENVLQVIDGIFTDVANGRDISVESVEQAVRPLVASVLRNADAFLLVEGLRRHDSYSYAHAIGCAALGASFGRHMGFAEDTIISLSAGGLLMDVGKTSLPEALLEFPGPLAPADVSIARSHVEHGMAILAGSDIVDQDVLDILRAHHERHDGSGYPQGLSGNAIPVAGRMLAIIDTYDAMVNTRPYRAGVSRYHALRQIYAGRGTQFQAELVEQFQVCLGVYPTGSLVELSTGEVALVTAQNQVRRLRPQVTLLSGPDKQPSTEFRQLDLMAQSPSESEIEIVRSLAVGDYGVDASELFLQP